jgi:hypothetical protein
MELSKEKFVDVIQEIRKVLKTDECAECSCPNSMEIVIVV